jgi:hypothetical protein
MELDALPTNMRCVRQRKNAQQYTQQNVFSIRDQSSGSNAIGDGKRLRKRNLAFEKAHLAKIDAMKAAT